MKLDQQDIDRLAQRVSSNSEYVVLCSMKMMLEEIQPYCESPIEALFGATFIFACNVVSFGRARATLAYINEPERARVSLLPAQWELVPQYKWESYRIDFAIFSNLPEPVFVECDGHDFHERTKEQAAHDREKDRRIQTAGIPILRFTGSQIHNSPLDCAFEVHNFLHKRVSEAAKKSA